MQSWKPWQACSRTCWRTWSWRASERRLRGLGGGCPGRVPEAEEIFELVKADCPDIGLATVYRTIQLLGSLHLIDRVSFDDGFVRYEMGSALEGTGRHRHHHLICIKCGRVISFQDDLLEELEGKIAATTGFRVVNHEVKLYGYCVECGGELIEEKRE